ncbi:MAG TPA: lactate utilization protein C [Terriglobales bacterium]
MSTAARTAIFESIRAASGSVAHDVAAEYAALPRPYKQIGTLSHEDRLHLMIERLREYDADVIETTPPDLPRAIAAQLAASGRRKFVAPSGLAKEWLIEGYNWLVDNDLKQDQIEAAEGVVTASFCGVAESGTIVLHHSLSEGRRVLSLLPDWHLCVLRASQIVETFPEYIARCAEPPRLATYVSGPSATADIEMTRIKGVHGPRFLNVIIVRDKV